MDLEQQAVEFMSTSAVDSRSQRQKVSVTLRTIGVALPSTAELWSGDGKHLWRCSCVFTGWQLWAQVSDIMLELKHLSGFDGEGAQTVQPRFGSFQESGLVGA